MDGDDRLRLDYEQTAGEIGALTDVRFKLLGFVPTIATAAVVIVGAHPTTGALVSVGLLGLVATVGILLYELRNTELLDAALDQTDDLRRLLGLGVGRLPRAEGPGRRKLFGALPIGQDQAVGLVYGAALGGWSYLLAWGALHGLGVSGARTIGGVIGACCAVAVVVEVGRVSGESKTAARRVAAASPPGADAT